MFRFWQRKNYFHERPEGYIPVNLVLDRTFDLRRCMTVARGLLKCLIDLHTRGLRQNVLYFEDVYVKDCNVSACKKNMIRMCNRKNNEM